MLVLNEKLTIELFIYKTFSYFKIFIKYIQKGCVYLKVVDDVRKRINQSIQKLNTINDHNEQIIKVMEYFHDLFPVKDVLLYRYSPIGFLTEGVSLIDPDGALEHIRHIRDDVRTVPAAYKAVRQRQATLVMGNDVAKHSHRYILPEQTNLILFVPICFRSSVVGIIASTRFSAPTEEIVELLPFFTYYGEMVGKIFEKPYLTSDVKFSLNEREVEIMQLLALGESTKSVAEMLYLSEYTVKDYIKSALRKLGVNNRTYAIAKLIRMGIIS